MIDPIGEAGLKAMQNAERIHLVHRGGKSSLHLFIRDRRAPLVIPCVTEWSDYTLLPNGTFAPAYPIPAFIALAEVHRTHAYWRTVVQLAEPDDVLALHWERDGWVDKTLEAAEIHVDVVSVILREGRADPLTFYMLHYATDRESDRMIQMTRGHSR